MKLTIIVDDQLVSIDNVAFRLDFSDISIDLQNWHAVQWDGNYGEIEHKDLRVKTTFEDLTFLQPFINLYEEEVARRSAPMPLEHYRQVKYSEIDDWARSLITGGFTSSALGEVHTYFSKETDQLNLIGAVATGAELPFPCLDENGVFQRRMHSHEQLRQVAMDGAVYKQQIFVQKDDLIERAASATDLHSLNAVVLG